MKRLFLSVAMILGLTTVSFAQQDKLEISDWNMEARLPKLSRYLELNAGQYDDVAHAIEFFSDKMQSARYSKENRQIKYLNEAVYGNLKLMKKTLSREQYKRYLRLMNSQLNRTGLTVYLKKTAFN